MTELNKDVQRLRELLAQLGAATWDKCVEEDFDYDFYVPGNYTHCWVKTGPRDADRIAIGADLMDDDGLYARLELVLAARNLLPKIIEEHTALLSAYAGMKEVLERARNFTDHICAALPGLPDTTAEDCYVCLATAGNGPKGGSMATLADARQLHSELTQALSQKAEGEALPVSTDKARIAELEVAGKRLCEAIRLHRMRDGFLPAIEQSEMALRTLLNKGGEAS